MDFKYLFSSSQVACEQAVLSALAAGQEKEGELATRSQEFEYLHRKSRCEMLIGGDDISNDVITLGVCFHVFSNASLHSPSFPLRADWRKTESSVNGEPQGTWRWNSNFRDVVPFPAPPPEHPGELARRLVSQRYGKCWCEKKNRYILNTC